MAWGAWAEPLLSWGPACSRSRPNPSPSTPAPRQGQKGPANPHPINLSNPCMCGAEAASLVHRAQVVAFYALQWYL